MLILTGEEMRACDLNTTKSLGIPSLVLMERAALAVAEAARNYLDRDSLCLALAGPGNNGADAVAAARILAEEGYTCEVLLVSDRDPAPGSSLEAQLFTARAYQIPVRVFDGKAFPHGIRPALILDGIFGTGLARRVEGRSAAAISEVRRFRQEKGARVLAVDIPSGISADDGRSLGCHVEADETVTFAFSKCGHYLGQGRAASGKLTICPIGITERAFLQPPSMYNYSREEIREKLPVRDPDGNKGTFGKLLIMAGSFRMCGAALLCAGAALRSGAGMVKVLTHERNRIIVQTALPEALLELWGEEEDPEGMKEKLRASLSWADTVAAGPGIGRDEAAGSVLKALLGLCLEEAEKGLIKGLVLDADALWFLARDPEVRGLVRRLSAVWPLVLTPHMGEFAALMETSIPEAKEKRISLVREGADRYQAVLVCKDARTLTAAPGRKEIHINLAGNAGMACAGSGDVLTGVCAALLAVTGDPREAAALAVSIHAMAGDRARDRLGEHGMTAGDIERALPGIFKELEG